MTPEIAFVSYAREVSEEPKNVDTFMARWGEDYGFTRIEAENLFADSEANSPEDPFHNYDHHLESLWIVMALVDLDRKNGNDTDGKTIAVAEMLHDVGVRKGKDVIPEFQGAAFVIQNYERYGLSFEQGIIAADLIIATAENAVIDSDDKAKVALSDIFNVGSDHVSEFKAKTALLWKELRAKNKKLTRKEFRADSARLLSKYYMRLWERDHSLDWFRFAQSNILGFIIDSATAEKLPKEEYVKSLESPAVNEFFRIAMMNGTNSGKTEA